MKEFDVVVVLKIEGRDRWQADALAAQAVDRMAGSPGVEKVTYRFIHNEEDKKKWLIE